MSERNSSLDRTTDTPRTDAIALRLVGKKGVFCDDASLEQYNDLVRLARQLERDLETCRDAHMANCLAADTLRAEIRELREAKVNPRRQDLGFDGWYQDEVKPALVLQRPDRDNKLFFSYEQLRGAWVAATEFLWLRP